MEASPMRSLAKTLTWRITATLTTIILVLIFVGDLTIAFTVGAFEVVIKMVVYYLHERVWNNVKCYTTFHFVS